MRLLNIDTLQLHEFFDRKIPPYYILSHRWQENEVTLEEVQHRKNLDKAGWLKIQNLCNFIRRVEKQPNSRGSNITYVWIDTCCIDKQSSAELSEAINSMYKWYQHSSKCYAYLSDVSSGTEYEVNAALHKSQWFTRGWTLQELLAPADMVFVDKNWDGILGSREQLSKVISEITRIPCLGDTKAGYYSIATRMSWASMRVCAREEDLAYCLMGLFDVNMPLLYGEGGQKAFLRLQLEILKISDDESIFAWTIPSQISRWNFSGLLADSPSQFHKSADTKWKLFNPWRSEILMTNKGLKLESILWPLPKAKTDPGTGAQTYALPLHCFIDGGDQPICILLQELVPRLFVRHFARQSKALRELRRDFFDPKRQQIIGEKQVFYVVQDIKSMFDQGILLAMNLSRLDQCRQREDRSDLK